MANPVRLNLSGTAGQSFGVFNAPGLEMNLRGDANDYVGKGMAGGRLVIAPPEGITVLHLKRRRLLVIRACTERLAELCMPRAAQASDLLSVIQAPRQL